MTDHSPIVLIVDDDDANRYAVARMLRHAGYRIEEASAGVEALERAATVRPDLVLLDVQLPDLDGFEVARRLRLDPASAHVPVVHLTAHATTPDERMRGLEGGAAAYLTRPVPSRELVATVASLIGVHRAEQQARRAARQWQVTFDAIPDAIYVLGPDGGVARANRAMQDAWRAAAPDRTLAGTAHQDMARAFFGEASPEPIPHAADRVVDERATPDGRTLQWTLDPIVGMHGEVDGAVGILRDVTEQRALGAELQRRHDQLVLADRRKDEFLAMLGHELRNPLSAISTAASLLERHDEASSRIADTIRRQITHLGGLVDGLLDVARVTRGVIALERAPLDLRDVARRAVSIVEPLVRSHGHDLAIDVGEDELPVEGDLVRLTQVVANLLDNAAKYTPDGGRVSLRCRRDRSEAVITVADDGAGIAPEHLEHIFDAFVQLNPTFARTRGGLGIGLTLVRSLMAHHRGTVSVKSEGLGRGTEVEVRLPIEAGEPIQRLSIPGTTASQPASGTRLVVVEDNDDNRDMLTLALEGAGYDVSSAPDGPSGLEALLAIRPACAIVDLGLPGIDGFEVARRLRKADPGRTTRLIALSGYGADRDRDEAIAAGFDAHLLKPVDPARLLAAIRGE